MNPFLIFMLGFSLLMTLITLFKSSLNDWERANLYCALMFACCFLDCSCRILRINLVEFIHYSDNIQARSPIEWFNHLTPTFLLFLYRAFLNIQAESPRFYRFLTVSLWLILACIFVEVIFTFFPQYEGVVTFAVTLFQVVLLLVFLVLPFYALRFWRHPIFRYAAWSSWSIIFFYGSFLLLSGTGWDKNLPRWVISNMLYMILVIDGILFIFALTVRDKQLLIEKIRLEQQATANELKALRAQMNPHFIFNALNSIKSFTLNHDTEGANFYLTKFSKLIRQVLENSRNERISLKSELETLILYLDMEKLRVGEKFNYVLKIADDVETEFIELPPMLIQPYVENAIWHGLMHKEEKGEVRIELTSKDDKILIVKILDNGIGRKKAAELQSKTGTTHKSFGMKITAERLDIIRKLYQLDIKISIEDLKNTEGSAIGTSVSLQIPI